MRRIAFALLGGAGLIGLLTTEGNAITGNDYRVLPDHPRMMYVVGVVDGWQTVSDPGVRAAVPRCAANRKMSHGQLVAIVDKYLEANPAKWDGTAPDLIFVAIDRGVCK